MTAQLDERPAGQQARVSSPLKVLAVALALITRAARTTGPGLLATVALVASVVTSTVAILQTNILTRQTEVLTLQTQMVQDQRNAAVWPHLQVTLNAFVDEDDDPPSGEWAIVVANTGIGPAIVRSLVVLVDDKPVQDWAPALQTLSGLPGVPFTTSTVDGHVIPAGEEVEIVEVGGVTQVRALMSPGERLKVRVCYCSVLDQCWERRRVWGVPKVEPISVPQCIRDESQELEGRSHRARPVLPAQPG